MGAAARGGRDCTDRDGLVMHLLRLELGVADARELAAVAVADEGGVDDGQLERLEELLENSQAETERLREENHHLKQSFESLLKTAYIIDNLGHLKQLKKTFKDKDVGFFNRDNFWIMLPNKKSFMNEKDRKSLSAVKTDTAELNKKYK